jgi:hypothetical protein
VQPAGTLSVIVGDAQSRQPWRLAMFKLFIVLLLALVVWSAVGVLDWILGFGVFAVVFGVVGAVIGVVVGVLGAVFGVVVGMLGAVIGILAIVLIPLVLLAGVVALLRTAF